jgi:hypothetical protein
MMKSFTAAVNRASLEKPTTGLLIIYAFGNQNAFLCVGWILQIARKPCLYVELYSPCVAPQADLRQ